MARPAALADLREQAQPSCSACCSNSKRWGSMFRLCFSNWAFTSPMAARLLTPRRPTSRCLTSRWSRRLRTAPTDTVPPSLYYTSAHGAGGESKPLVIHCSDPRYQPHFQEFLQTGLGLAHYALIAVPGGPHCLTLSDYLPKFAWAGWRWVKVMERVAQPERIILIAHDDCRWYVTMGF